MCGKINGFYLKGINYYIFSVNSIKPCFNSNSYKRDEILQVKQFKTKKTIFKNHNVKVAFFDILGEPTVQDLEIKNCGIFYRKIQRIVILLIMEEGFIKQFC